VEGPACKIKETRGLFSKRTPADSYGVGLTRTRLDLGRPRPIRRRATHACGRAAARGGALAGVGRKMAPSHGFARGFHLRVAGVMAKLNMHLHGWFGWRRGTTSMGADDRRC
jgi:hypothetical protein